MDTGYKMVESVMNVRAKTIPTKRKSLFRFLPYTGGALVLAIAATLGFDAYSGVLGFFPPSFEIVESAAGRIIKVPAGGNIQAAIAKSESGDIIELQAGATYYGEIKLPNKPLSGFVTIQTSAIADLPVDKRVSPANAGSMAKILSPDAQPVISAANGAHHYRFVGIEFAPSTSTYVYNLLLLGNGETAANLPHDIEIDRSYLHPFKKGVTRRGIALNSASTTIKNSYIEGFGFAGEETQGICGWTGTRNAKIINNYIEGGAENIMFGGSDPVSADLIPTDIEIRGNHLNKPESWSTKITVKTLFELKNAKKVRFIDNLLTNNYKGSAFRITVRNQDNGAPFSTVEDVLIKDNVIKNAGEGINILGKDDTYPSQTLKRLTIENNLFLNLAEGGNFEGSGYFIQIADGEDIMVANNTVFNTGNTVTFYGTDPRSFVMRNNIVGHGTYGVHGLDLKSPQSRAMFAGNVVVNNKSIGDGDRSVPPNSIFISDYKEIGFANPSLNDFRLGPTSKFKGKGATVFVKF